MLGRVIKNSVSNVSVPIIKLAIAFIMTPIILRVLGNYDYGIWEIVMAVVGYMGLLDLGLQPAIVRYVARYNALADKGKLSKVYSSSLFFMSLIGILAFTLILAWLFLVPELLSDDRLDMQTRYVIFLMIIATQMLFIFPGAVFQAFHQGYQRYHMVNTITIIMSVIGCFVIAILLLQGYGLLTLALGNAVGQFIKYSIYGGMLRLDKYGGYRFKTTDISWKAFKELFSYSIKSFIQIVAVRITTHTDSIVIGAFLGPATVAFYIIPANLVLYSNSMIKSMTLAFMPYFSELDAKGDKSKVAEIYIVASRYVAAISLPMICGIYFLGVPFLARWIGPEYAESGKWVLYFLTAAIIVPSINPFSTRLFQGIAQHGILATINSIIAVLNLGLSLILVQYYGKEGVALGTLLPALMLEPVILYYSCRYIGKSMLRYMYDVLLPLLIPNISLLVLLWVLSTKFIIDSYLGIVSVVLLSALVYSLLFFALSIQRDEQRFILKKIKEKIAMASG